MHHLSINDTIQLCLYEIIDPFEFGAKSLDSESDKWCDIKWLPCTTLLQHHLVSPFILIEIVGKTIKTVHIVITLKKNARLQQARYSAVSIPEWWNRYQKKGGQQRFHDGVLIPMPS